MSKDSFEIGNKLSFSGEYIVEVVDAETNEVVKKVSGKNAICPYLSDMLTYIQGCQSLMGNGSVSYGLSVYFSYFTIFENDNNLMKINNNRLPKNEAYSGSISSNYSDVAYFPVQEVSGTDRTIGFTLQIGTTQCNNQDVDSIVIYSTSNDLFDGTILYKFESTSSSYERRTVNNQTTIDINPLTESIEFLSAIGLNGTSYLCKYTSEGVYKYQIRKMSDNSVTWETTVSAFYSNERRRGVFFVMGASNKDLITIDCLTGDANVYSYNSTVYSDFSMSSSSITNVIPIGNDQYIEGTYSSSAITFTIKSLIDGSVISTSTETPQNLFNTYAPDCITSIMNSYSYNSSYIDFVNVGYDLLCYIAFNAQCTYNSGETQPTNGYSLFNKDFTYLGNAYFVGASSAFSHNDLRPRYGWKITFSSTYISVSETIRRYTLSTSEFPIGGFLPISLVSFPTIHKTKTQILRITYKLTQHNVGFPNKPSYLGLTPTD